MNNYDTKVINSYNLCDQDMDEVTVRSRGIIINSFNEILMCYSNGLKHYEFPGGHLEKNESINEGLIRELKEPWVCSDRKKLRTLNIFNYVNKFGFGSKTGIDLNGEGTGILFKLYKMGPVETATTSFGQGISVTPAQQVNAVSSAINGGNLLKPYVVKTISEPETNLVILENKIEVVRRVISEETSNMVRYALESVVANGTGHNSYIENYRVGSKTGTAQKVENGVYLSGNYILSFIGFMPANEPKVIVYVAVNNPKGITQYGGTVSAPIAKNVLTTAIDDLDIKPDLEGMTRKYLWYEAEYIKLPDVIGLEKKQAIKELKEFTLEYSGTGETILYMSPEPGYYLKKGGTVKLLLGNK